MIFIYVIPVILILLADFYFYLTLRQVQEKRIRLRIFLFIIGFLFIIFGVLIYAIFGIIEQAFGYSNSAVEYLTWLLATFFWVSGPIIQLVGFYLGKGKRNQTEDLLEN